jgi:hypothetical protein
LITALGSLLFEVRGFGNSLARSAEVPGGAFGVEESVIDGAKSLAYPVEHDLGKSRDKESSAQNRYLGR